MCPSKRTQRHTHTSLQTTELHAYLQHSVMPHDLLPFYSDYLIPERYRKSRESSDQRDDRKQFLEWISTRFTPPYMYYPPYIIGNSCNFTSPIDKTSHYIDTQRDRDREREKYSIYFYPNQTFYFY